MRRMRGGRWWLIVGGAAVVGLGILGFQVFRGSALTGRDMAEHLTFPATYSEREEDFTGVEFTLRADGTARLDGVSLGGGERIDDSGRRCLTGDLRSVVGEARWWPDDSGWVVIEVGDQRTRFHQDDPLLMAEGWAKVYLLTPCDEQLSATFVTPDADYSQ